MGRTTVPFVVVSMVLVVLAHANGLTPSRMDGSRNLESRGSRIAALESREVTALVCLLTVVLLYVFV